MISKNFCQGYFLLFLYTCLKPRHSINLCPVSPDVSGKWVVTGVDTNECCSDKGEI